MYKYGSAFPFFSINKLVTMAGISTGLEYLMKTAVGVGTIYYHSVSQNQFCEPFEAKSSLSSLLIQKRILDYLYSSQLMTYIYSCF